MLSVYKKHVCHAKAASNAPQIQSMKIISSKSHTSYGKMKKTLRWTDDIKLIEANFCHEIKQISQSLFSHSCES